MEKKVNSGAVLISEVFGTGEHFGSRKGSEAWPFRRLSAISFVINNFRNS